MPEKLHSSGSGRGAAKRVAVLIGVLLLLAAAVALRGALLRSTASSRDFISYWASARLLASHHNPYDRAAVLALERGAGGHFEQPFLMRNPPWALFLALPLGWLSAPTGALAWLLAIIAAGLASVRLLRPLHMKRVPLSLLLFAPTVICAGAEQTGTFILLGVALFLRLEERRPFAAGLALTLACAKPHLLLLLWPVLLLECWRRRQWRTAGGIATGLAAAMGMALALDPQVWGDYLASMRAEDVGADFYPNVSNLLRAGLAPHALWPAVIPTLLGLVFAAWYWRKMREEWQWGRHGAMLMAVSVLTAPYSWPSDQVLFLPVLLAVTPLASRKALSMLALLNGAALLVFVRHPILGSPAYLWMAPVWMAWCAWAYLRPAAERVKIRVPDPVAG